LSRLVNDNLDAARFKFLPKDELDTDFFKDLPTADEDNDFRKEKSASLLKGFLEALGGPVNHLPGAFGFLSPSMVIRYLSLVCRRQRQRQQHNKECEKQLPLPDFFGLQHLHVRQCC
jgi:hypothetical protein